MKMRETTLILVILSYSSFLWGEIKPNIYMADSRSWAIKSRSPTVTQGSSRTILRRETPLVTDAIGYFHKHKDCRDFGLTIEEETAMYTFVVGGQDTFRKNVKVVFNSDAPKVIYRNSTFQLKNAVKDACKSVKNDLESRWEWMHF